MKVYERQVTFRNSRDQQLFGVMHLPLKEAKLPVVIMAHGFTDDKTGDNRLFVKFARLAAEEGIAVLRFDFAGSGDSEGDFSQTTLDSQKEDLSSAVDFLYEFPSIDRNRISLVGYSLGGAVSIILAATDQRIRSFIGWAPVSFLKAVFQRILGKNTVSLVKKNSLIACRNGCKQFYLRKGFFEGVRDSNPLEMINMISPRPVLLIQGLDDKKVLPKETELLFRNAGKPKRLRFIQGAGHSFAFSEKRLFEITLRHLEKQVLKKST